jgi:DNA-binding NarL/FixJ family response regulator
MCRVLLVDDHAGFRKSFAGYLRSCLPSICIEEASDGQEALDQIRTFGPLLVFMDIKLPGNNGLELTQTIKHAFPAIRIVMLTSHDLPEYRRAAALSGASDFWTKDTISLTKISDLLTSVCPAPAEPAL